MRSLLEGGTIGWCYRRDTGASRRTDDPRAVLAILLVMVELPSSGCWEITGEYEGESARFVVHVRA